MKKGFLVLLLVSLLSSGCSAATQSPASPPVESAIPSSASSMQKGAEESPSPAATLAPTTASSSRKAILSEAEKSVFFRPAPDSQPQPASVGMEILPKGAIETGEDGRARLDLQPEGTIIRVGPNSSFTLAELNEVDGKPQTGIELLFGKIYILLNGGSLKVQTPGGVASVQGSVMSVEYNPKTKAAKIACLEGRCAVEDEEGNEVELTDLELSFLFEGEEPTDPFTVDSEEIWDWYNEIPEMPEFFEEMPDPEDFPDPYFDFDFQFEMPTFEPEATLDPDMTPDPGMTPDAGATEDPSGGWEPTEDPGGWEPPEDSGGGEDPPPAIPEP